MMDGVDIYVLVSCIFVFLVQVDVFINMFYNDVNTSVDLCSFKQFGVIVDILFRVQEMIFKYP